MNTDKRPDLLRRLDAHWSAMGDVMGNPVEYNVTAAPALQGQFTEISMNDVQVPSHYEARIYIGFDGDTNQVIAHWMDSSGAQYSIPHGTGHIEDNVSQFIVPYPESAFTDRFAYDPEGDTWVLEITAAQPDGTWKHFGRYSCKRAT